MIRNTTQAWGSVAKALHWAAALLVFALFVLGWAAVLTPMSPLKLDLFIWHKSIGLSFLVLALARLAWRMTNPAPRLPANTSSLERFLARAVHAALYVCMILMPLSGYAVNSSAGFSFKLFGWVRVPNLIPADKAMQNVAELIHLCTFWVFLLLVCIHVAAALRHNRANNNVLGRMLPMRPGRQR